ncbi:TPA: hypothetical protein IAA82_07070 [Candidatus Galligastranaerophilus gallistercoris]|nr:hypothetical protein [Candidatus Galligastranaerophilus gallistercoris]
MAIIEETIEIEYDKEFPPKVNPIEEFIKQKGINPVRYSLISIDRAKNKIKLGISGIKD